MESKSKQAGQCPCSDKGRNLVMCIDGTANQLFDEEANVFKLFCKLSDTPTQLAGYDSGTGPRYYWKHSQKLFKPLQHIVDSTVDSAITWNLEQNIIWAHEWLSEFYQENDRIYLFGFSRGAYQVRVLAGMIDRVGLMRKSNKHLIPSAYELYTSSGINDATRLCFKKRFSYKNVHIHFIGVWDTIFSVGVVRGTSFPLVDSADHVCVFRHALALDEHRVSFLPEYAHGGVSKSDSTVRQPSLNGSPHIKEVWFPGTHSDIGGSQIDTDLDLHRAPFHWMLFEAASNGIQFIEPFKVNWQWNGLAEVKESLTWFWHVMECIPLKMLSYKTADSTTIRWHRGQGRKIMPGQEIHSSIAFCPKYYRPKAILPQSLHWGELVGQANQSTTWPFQWKKLLEMDILDDSLVINMMEKLNSEPVTDNGIQKFLQVPGVLRDLVLIFKCSESYAQGCILVWLGSQQASIILSERDRCWLSRILGLAHEHDKSDTSSDQALQDIINTEVFDRLGKMLIDEQRSWVPEITFAILEKILHQCELSSEILSNVLSFVCAEFAAEYPNREVAKRVLAGMLGNEANRQRVTENDDIRLLLSTSGKTSISDLVQ